MEQLPLSTNNLHLPHQDRNDAAERFPKMNPQEFSWEMPASWESATVKSADVPTLTRVKLKEMFTTSISLTDVKARKIRDFLELKQNGMSVGEYVLKI
ncbi:hypothetical protein OIU85_019867 [Salix viminalis]|uniref:Uncharacterized protein n=1 Tax=Salix viminalis TaxID=40686 RepID=A0A9Q0NIC6_SALVM|nr:hypothetical protein OIU85_019867 [Salix viminalis]